MRLQSCMSIVIVNSGCLNTNSSMFNEGALRICDYKPSTSFLGKLVPALIKDEVDYSPARLRYIMGARKCVRPSALLLKAIVANLPVIGVLGI